MTFQLQFSCSGRVNKEPLVIIKVFLLNSFFFKFCSNI